MDYQRYTKIENLRLVFWWLSGLAAAFASVATFLLFSTTPSSLAAPQFAIAPEQYEWIPELPVRLIISAINVDAEIEYVGLDKLGTGEMTLPANIAAVAWSQPGVRPGMRGSAVMSGYGTGKGAEQTAFFALEKLEIGDEVMIMSAKRIEDVFMVVRITKYDYGQSVDDVYVSTDGKKRLNLIVGGGTWLPLKAEYNQRTVVFTELVTDVE